MAGDSERTMLRGGGVATANESIAGEPSVEKVCRACGVNVSGKKRMKDADGQYWCYDCGMEDTVRKHPDQAVECFECHERFAPSKLVDFDGKMVCPTCDGKLRQVKKRAEARIAAAAEEARQQEVRKKQIMIGLGILGVIVVLLILSKFATS